VSASGATVPARSGTVLVAPLAEAWAVYDQEYMRASVVSALAGVVLASGGQSVDTLAVEVAETTGVDVQTATTAVAEAITGLVEAGFLDPSSEPTTQGRPSPALDLSAQLDAPEDERPLARDRSGTSLGAVQAMLDERLVFRGTDVELLAEIDSYLGVEAVADAPTRVFDVEPTDDGGVLLQAAEVWDFPSVENLLVQLPGVINDFAPRVTDFLVLHSGAVRTPGGEVILVAGLPEAGKSTLTAALVAAGCDYLGDELTGLRSGSLVAVGFPRALALDDGSLEVLGLTRPDPDNPFVPVGYVRPEAAVAAGDTAAPSRLIIPFFDAAMGFDDDPGPAAPVTEEHPEASSNTAGAQRIEVERLDPRHALEALLGTALNLGQSHQQGWETLCALAERVPVDRIRHNDSVALAAAVLAGEI